MHELGILREVVRIVEKTVTDNSITKVKTVVLQVGELSGIVPNYVEKCYVAACHKTILEGSGLQIEIIPGLGRCWDCGKVFNVVENDGKCPICSHTVYDILSGRDFTIKHIIA